MTPHHHVSGPHNPYLRTRLIDARWLLGSFALSLLLTASVSYASHELRAPAKRGAGRVLSAAPSHGTVQAGKVLAVTPRFAPVVVRGSRSRSGQAR